LVVLQPLALAAFELALAIAVCTPQGQRPHKKWLQNNV
jgi:hypothetical protein